MISSAIANMILSVALVVALIAARHLKRDRNEWRAYALADEDALGFLAWVRQYGNHIKWTWDDYEGDRVLELTIGGVKASDREPLVAFRKARAMLEARHAIDEALATARESVGRLA